MCNRITITHFYTLAMSETVVDCASVNFDKKHFKFSDNARINQIKQYDAQVNVINIILYGRIKIKLTLLIGSRLQHRRVKSVKRAGAEPVTDVRIRANFIPKIRHYSQPASQKVVGCITNRNNGQTLLLCSCINKC